MLETAVEFRDALIILLLTYEPLRRKDLADLPLTAMEWRKDGSVSVLPHSRCIWPHRRRWAFRCYMRADDFAAKFLKVTEGGTYLHRECGRASVSIESSTSKNDQVVDRVFTGDLAEYLVLWMRRYRTILTAGVERKATTLLIGQGGASLTAGNLTQLVRTWTSKHLGLALSPHDVRGAVAYTVVAQTGDVLAASRLLHNRDSCIVERHYSGVAGQVRASQALDRTVEGVTCTSSISRRKK
jgi:hypothetical protein